MSIYNLKPYPKKWSQWHIELRESQIANKVVRLEFGYDRIVADLDHLQARMNQSFAISYFVLAEEFDKSIPAPIFDFANEYL